MQPRIAVFAGSRCPKDKEEYYFNIAYKTGKLLGESGFTVVTGGGMGLMNETMRGCIEAKGHTIGVILDKKGLHHSEYIQEMYKEKNLQPRQQKIIDLSQGFIALPGGIGTFREISEIIALKHLKEIDFPTPLILTGKYFYPFMELIYFMVNEGFMENSLLCSITHVQYPSQAVGLLKKYFRK